LGEGVVVRLGGGAWFEKEHRRCGNVGVHEPVSVQIYVEECSSNTKNGNNKRQHVIRRGGRDRGNLGNWVGNSQHFVGGRV